MRRWRQTVLGLAAAALWVCACGKSQETEDAKARAARPTIAPARFSSTIAPRITIPGSVPYPSIMV